VKYLVRVGTTDVEVVIDGEAVTVDGGVAVASHVSELPGTPVRLLTVGDHVHRVVARAGPTRGLYTLWLDGFRYEVEALDERTRAIRELAGASTAATGPAPLKAPMPGMIVRVAVQAGDQVVPGQSLIVMEAMKMENELRATVAATVKSVHAQPGTAVEKGALLLEME
jgi:acetyl/propionyl-CoA carboxylase alpha subunit